MWRVTATPEKIKATASGVATHRLETTAITYNRKKNTRSY